jgi:glycosyltransferase involved in cell wall biosynthesis
MTKILIVAGMYQKLCWDSWGTGVEAFNVELWRMLNQNKNTDCTILAPSDTKLDAAPYSVLKWNQPSREVLEHLTRPSNTERERKIEFIEKEKFDFIIINSDVDLPFSFYTHLAKLGKPIMFFIHCHAAGIARYNFWKNLFLLKKEYPHIRIAVESNYLKRKIFEKTGYDIDFVIPLTFDEGLEQADFVESPLSEVAYVGRITKLKNSHHLVSWLENSQFKLHLLGEKWSSVASILMKELIWQQTPYPKNVIAHGQVSQNKLKHILKDKFALISPLPTETFSLAAFGAQKLGVPVVSIQKEANEAINEYMIEGQTGVTVLLHPKEKAKDIAPRVLEAITKCKEFDRRFIYEHFRINYSNEKFLEQFIDKLKKCPEASNELKKLWN